MLCAPPTAPLTIAVDTREQEPYTFQRVPTARMKLDSGDYSVVGHETRVAVERKSMADFYNTVIKGRKRFYAELQRLGRMDHAVVLVEANWRDLIEHAYAGGASVASMEGTVHAIQIDFGIPVIWASDRQAAAASGVRTRKKFARLGWGRQREWRLSAAITRSLSAASCAPTSAARSGDSRTVSRTAAV